MRLLTPEENRFLDVFLHEATTAPVHRTSDERPPQEWPRVRRHLVHCVGL